jgi:hypothetical protein
VERIVRISGLSGAPARWRYINCLIRTAASSSDSARRCARAAGDWRACRLVPCAAGRAYRSRSRAARRMIRRDQEPGPYSRRSDRRFQSPSRSLPDISARSTMRKCGILCSVCSPPIRFRSCSCTITPWPIVRKEDDDARMEEQ